MSKTDILIDLERAENDQSGSRPIEWDPVSGKVVVNDSLLTEFSEDVFDRDFVTSALINVVPAIWMAQIVDDYYPREDFKNKYRDYMDIEWYDQIDEAAEDAVEILIHLNEYASINSGGDWLIYILKLGELNNLINSYTITEDIINKIGANKKEIEKFIRNMTEIKSRYDHAKNGADDENGA